ncbi:MAG: hypothetical protein DWI57_01820 [Chloroflexi bacterium]|nr:MAG: hypothetical protein DWI57_01820 [Chloroflexota bacterium]
MSTYLYMNAWREILARGFDGQEVQPNVTPEWLVNPATRRRLKLDYLFPDIGVAVRFIGLTAKGQGKRSDWEALEDEQRDQTRVEMCKEHGVQLAVIDPADDPVKQMDGLLTVLSRASRVVAQGDKERAAKQKAMNDLAKVLKETTRIRTSLAQKPELVLATLAESWRDREAGIATKLQASSTAAQTNANGAKAARKFKQLDAGQRIAHTNFGQGVITAVDGEGADMRISILFDGDRERVFLASLVVDKLQAA